MDDARLRSVAKTVKDAAGEIVATFFNDRPFQLAAALGYYTLLSMAPLLLLLIGAAGLIFSEEAARGQLGGYSGSIMGKALAEAVQAMLANAGSHRTGVISTIVGTAVLIVAATTVFAQLQSALNQIWNVEAAPRYGVIMNFLRARLFSLGMVFALAFILLVSMVVSTLIAGLQYYFSHLFPGADIFIRIVYGIVSFLVVAGIIAMVFKFVPDVRIGWRDVSIGALITSALFTIGRYFIGLYIGHARFNSYGAAGSLILVVVWVYYASLILFFGAEITQVYTKRFGSQIRPSAHARFRDRH
ncbi:MAG TPA: YihY/virulence factor BrkB family protein [Gammaproteobacteria bacterium]|nr:YihY/virulence factor BrkB family protein [Gammaproteobacteria bacterium]